MDFIYELYKSDNFIIILSVILVILVVLFIIVFFWGKKDKKLEETKKLEKINLDTDGFKEEHTEEVKVEVKPEEEVVVKEFTPEVEKKIVTEEVKVEPVEVKEEVKVEEPVIKEDTKPLFSDTEGSLDRLNKVMDEIDKIPEVEVKKEKEIEVKSPFKPSEVFSSVYVKKEEEKPILEKEEEVNIENIKPEEVEIKKEETSKLFVIDEDDEEIELPSLKR